MHEDDQTKSKLSDNRSYYACQIQIFLTKNGLHVSSVGIRVVAHGYQGAAREYRDHKFHLLGQPRNADAVRHALP